VTPVSIIMPILDEGPALAGALRPLQAHRAAGHELILVDGGSRDTGPQEASGLCDRLLHAPRGRAAQMNAGAAAARHDILLFLHADTRLPANAPAHLAAALAGGHGWGRFNVRIEGRSALLPLIALMMNWRSRLTGMATGDQAIFIRRDLFTRIGGYADLPIMEDLDLSRRLRPFGPPACLSGPAVTSGRRWDRHGAWRTIFLMWRLRAAFYLGADPRHLAEKYGYAPRKD
jgi:rSAM/selenodomain-associated transferase 2